MIQTARTDMYRDYLAQEGYVPKLDGDNLIFKHEGKTLVLVLDDDDELFFRIILPNFWEIESEEERRRVMRASNAAAAQTKVAKVFPVENNVWAAVELFCPNPESFKAVFARSLSALQSGVDVFVKEMQQ